MDKRPTEMQKIIIQLSKLFKSLSKKDFNLQMNSESYKTFDQTTNKKEHTKLGHEWYTRIYIRIVCAILTFSNKSINC